MSLWCLGAKNEDAGVSIDEAPPTGNHISGHLLGYVCLVV